MNEKRTSANPFHDTSMTQGYEQWYMNEGRRADRLEKNVLEWLLAKFPDATSLLEVGCGTGHFTRWFQRQALETVGLDLSAAMIRKAVEWGAVPYLQGDAHHLPFRDQSFDLVALITTLEFLQDPLDALEEASRVAKGGLLLGVINRRSWVGRRYRRLGGPIWENARFYTTSELIHSLHKTVGRASAPFWKTTLWMFWPWALPLPWGGFIAIGMRVNGDP
jgi:ubiquinone/menaquinone biosynthesis C-methylase UbiE